MRIPANDNENLIESNRLTLIGRLTNTVIQKPRAVIDFMAQVWNLEGRVTGRPLGLDKFQIKFETEHELTQVLEKGPYHYKRWMLLLQQWEPTVSDQFPFNISFNVRIHGIPLHYWSEKTILTIGKQLGKCIIKDEKEAKIWVEINGLVPLTMNMEIEIPTEGTTEVEFEYIKIEKHCFTCFSLFHEESGCPYRPVNALPPKERKLGITQRIALQRIEAEKKRHDDRRGYSRPDYPRSISSSADDSFLHSRRGDKRTEVNRYRAEREDHGRDRSILSRTARSNSSSHRNNTPSFQYRVVEKSRPSSGSVTPHQSLGERREGLEARVSQLKPDRDQPDSTRCEITPTRSLQGRLGPSAEHRGSNTGSKERRSALERLAEPTGSMERSARKPPSFDSGRLQMVESRLGENIRTGIVDGEDIPTTDKLPASLRLGRITDNSGPSSKRGTIPVAPQSKTAIKRRVTKNQKRVVRSPLQVPSLLKQTGARVATSTRRKLIVDKDKNVPCDKAGTSKAVPSSHRKKNGQSKTVIIPGITRGGADFRSHQNSLP